MEQNVEFVESKLFEYGFLKDENGYVFAESLSDELAVLYTINNDLHRFEFEVIDIISGEKYMPFELSKSDYVTKLRQMVKSKTNKLINACANPMRMKSRIIVPAQVGDKCLELKNVERQVALKEKELESSILTREMKASNMQELGNVLDHSLTESLEVLKARKERLEYDLNYTLENDCRYATPSGEKASIGSLVTVKRYHDDVLSDKELTVLLIQGNVNEKTKALYDYKFADVNTGMGKALMDAIEGEDIEFEVSIRNRVTKIKVKVVRIDQNQIYAEYDYFGIDPFVSPTKSKLSM